MRWFSLVMVVLSVALIFAFSSENGVQSSSRSEQLVEAGARIRYRDFEQWPEHEQMNLVHQWHTPVRKLGHMAEFALLGFWLLIFVRSSGGRRWHWWLFFAPIVAISDEMHQVFVAGRSPSPIDVLIDTAGACLGVLVAILISRWWGRRISR